MAESISYIKVGNQDHPIDAVTVNGLTLTSQEKNSWNEKQDALTFDSIPTEDSNNPVKSGGVYEMITDNELVIATALNDLNDRLLDVEDNSLTSESDPVFMSSPASSITVANISTWNAKQDALTFDSLPTENSDNLVKSGALYTVLTNTELVVATALNDLNQRVSSNQSSISNLYEEIDRALTAVLTYKGTVGSNGDYTSLPSSHEVGDVYVVSSAGTFAGQSCEVGDYIICKTSRSTASDNDWNVVNGENQVSNSAATLAAAGSNVTIATVDGTNITISTPASWTGVSKNGTLTGVTFNGVSASVSNGVVSISLTYDSIPTENSDNLVKSGNLYTVIVDNEEVTAAALNDLNDRMINVENGMVNFSEQDPIFSNSAAASISSANISSWNAKQDALSFDSIPTENSTNLVKSGDLYTVITQNEFVAAAALNDLNDRVEVLEENQYSFDSLPTENSENLVNSGALYSVIVSNERVVATALNDLNDRLMVLENNMSDAFEDVNSDMESLASTLQTSEEVTAAALNDLNSRVTTLESGSGSGTGGGITGVTFNGVAASISNGVAAISASIPAAVTSTTVSGWGFTKNSGTITGISMNGSSKGTSGNVNLGNVVTAVSFNGTSVSPSSGVVTIAESDPVFSASVAASITASDISNWNNKANNGWYVRVGSGSSGNLLDGTPIDLYGGGCIHMSGGTNLIIDDNNNSGSVVLYNTMDWSGIVRTSVSTFASVQTATDTRTLQDDLNYLYSRLPEVSSSDVGKILVASYDSTKGYYWKSSHSLEFNSGLHFPGSAGTTNVNTGGISHDDYTDWSWISTSNGSGSYKTLQSDLDAIRQLPEVTSSDVNGSSGKILVASYDSTNGYHWEKKGSVTLYNNGSLAVPGSVGTTYLDTVGVFRNDRSSWDWIQTGTSSSSRRTLQSDLDAIRQLPAVTSTQNGQVLQVVNGQWTLVTPVSIYSGSSNPNNSQGTNGDLYLQTS